MLLWLGKGVSKVPRYATHHCGVGGVVLHNGKVLAVKEHGKETHWKLPGGMADLGENLDTAVQREIFEETGIKSQFQSVLSFRHQHKSQFGNSDLYFVCLLKATTDVITIDDEIKDAMWMEPTELRAASPFPAVITSMELLLSGRINDGLYGRRFLPYIKNRPTYELYLPKREANLQFDYLSMQEPSVL